MSPSWRDLVLYRDDTETTYGDRFKALRAEAAAGHASEVLDEALEMAVGLHQAGMDREALELLEELSSFVSGSDVEKDVWPWFFNTRGMALTGLGRYQEAEAEYLRMQELAEKVSDEERRRAIASTALQNRGIAAIEAGEAERAGPLLREAVETKHELGDWVAVIDILSSWAMAVAETGELDQADEMLERVENLARLLKDPRRIGAALGNRGALRARRGDFEGAEKDLRGALRYARAEGDRRREVQGMMGVGSSLAEQGKIGAALRWYRRAARLAEAGGMPMLELQLRRTVALTLLRTGRPTEGVPEMERALEIARELQDAHLTAESLADLGALHVEVGDDELAARELQAAREQFEELGNDGWRSQVVRNLGELQLRKGGVAEAEPLWSEAFELLDAFPASAAELAHRVAEAWAVHGAFDSAERWLTRELEQAARFEPEPALAWRTAVGGTVLNLNGKSGPGLRLLQDAVRRYEQLGDSGQATRVRLDVATALSDLGRHDDAIAELDRCLDYAREYSDRATRRHALANLAEVVRRTGDLERARAAAEEAGTLARELGDEEAVAHNLGNLGLVQFQAGDTQAARASFEEQMKLATRLRSNSVKASALGGLGDIEARASHFRRAARYFRRAADLHAGLWPVGEVENLGDLLCSLAESGQHEELQPIGQRLVDVAEATRLGDQAAAAFAEAARVLLRQGDVENAVTFYKVSLGLQLAEDPDDEEFPGQAMNTVIYRLGLMAAHVESELPEEGRSPFYDRVLASLDEEHDGVGTALRPLLDQVRESFEDQGVFEHWREVRGENQSDAGLGD